MTEEQAKYKTDNREENEMDEIRKERAITMLDMIDNNFKYHAPKEGQPGIYGLIRAKGKDMAECINYYCPNSREKSLAITKIEEAVMWANAAIARY